MKDFNKISDFIDGTLSSAEQAEFEQSIANDPTLKAEVNRQKMLIEGIKAARHTQLKTRLAAIPVTAGIAFRTKIAVGVAAVVTVGLTFLGYKELTKSPSSEAITTEQTIIAPQKAEKIIEPTNTEATQIESDKTVDSEETINEISKEITKQQSNIRSNKSNTKTTASKVSTNDKVNTDFDHNFEDDVHDSGIKKSDGTQHQDNISNDKVVTKTMIQPKIEKSKTLQYLYDNNNLTLYGDFSAEEYLVLDYRHIDKVFLYFNGSFYELKVKPRKSSLKSSLVTDPNLKAQLRAELQD